MRKRNNTGLSNSVDRDGRDILINCIIEQKTEWAIKIIKKFKELDINKKDNNGDTVIHACIYSKNYEMFDYLLKFSNINLHYSPDLLFCAFKHDKKNNSLIIKLIEHGLNPFDEKNEVSKHSFYDLLKEYDEGIRTIGGKKLDVKPIMNYILEKYKNK
jgi:hypothetical protein